MFIEKPGIYQLFSADGPEIEIAWLDLIWLKCCGKFLLKVDKLSTAWAQRWTDNSSDISRVDRIIPSHLRYNFPGIIENASFPATVDRPDNPSDRVMEQDCLTVSLLNQQPYPVLTGDESVVLEKLTVLLDVLYAEYPVTMDLVTGYEVFQAQALFDALTIYLYAIRVVTNAETEIKASKGRTTDPAGTAEHSMGNGEEFRSVPA